MPQRSPSATTSLISVQAERRAVNDRDPDFWKMDSASRAIAILQEVCIDARHADALNTLAATIGRLEGK